jgi:hypothetical protein
MAELAPLEVPTSYAHSFRLDDPIGGVHMNVMKAGLMAAHRVIAVSHGRAPRAGLRRPHQPEPPHVAPTLSGLHWGLHLKGRGPPSRCSHTPEGR